MNITPYQSKILKWLLSIAVVAALAFLGIQYPENELPPFPDFYDESPLEVVELGVTHFSGMEVSGSETDEFVVNQTSTGDIVEFRDNGTVVWRLADGGLVSNEGNCIDLDADDDTGLCADTDDQIDIELGGVDAIVLKAWPTSTSVTATVNIQEILGSTPAWTANTNVVNAFNIDISVGNANTGTHTIRGVMIDAITGDAEVTETAISVGTGWDVAASLLGTVTVGADGTAYDVTFYSDTAGDNLLWDQSEEALTITGTNAQDALNVDDGNVDINDDMDVDGTTNLDVVDIDDTLTVDTAGAVSFDAGAASNFTTSGAGIDLTLEAGAGRLILKGDEAAANAIHLNASDAVTTGIDIDVGSASGLTIDGGMVNIGGCTAGVADGDNDVCIAGVLEVDDEFELDGALDADSTANIAGALTLQALLYPSVADETITDGETLTPTVTTYNLSSGGAVTMTLAAAGTEGQILILCGDDANTITINDTNVRTNDGTVQTIGQYDCIVWMYIDSEWLELSESNNS